MRETLTLLKRAADSSLSRLAMYRDPIAWARTIGVEIGDDCRLLGVSRGTFGAEPYLIRLGDHVTLTEGVRFVTHDGGVWVFRAAEPDLDVVARIRIGNNVFIGMRSIVLPGVVIGDDCVVAAGSIVSRSIPSGTVVGGVPARAIKTTGDYRESLRGRELKTKNMSASEKRAYLSETLPIPTQDSKNEQFNRTTP